MIKLTSKAVAASAVVVLVGLTASGCASHRFVRDNVAVVDERVTQVDNHLTQVEGTAGEALQPVLENTLAAIARQATTLHDGVAQAVQQQLQALNTGFAASTSNVAEIWHQALAGRVAAQADFTLQMQVGLVFGADGCLLELQH